MADTALASQLTLSIVIPTKNEERYLPKLLNSIKKQDFNGDYEVIVADAHSTDSTKEIAKKHGCRIVLRGGKQATGRNVGAKAAKGRTLLFLDADTILPQNFLKFNYAEFLKKKLEVATSCASTADGDIIDTILQEMANLCIVTKIKLYIPGFCLMIDKKKFFELGGFDESASFEDLVFSNKLPKSIRFGKLPVRIRISMRRRQKIGHLKFTLTLITLAICRLLNKNYGGRYYS